MNPNRHTLDTAVDEHVRALRSYVKPDDLRALQARNAGRAKAAAQSLGERWVCHPSRHVRRITTAGGGA